MQPFKSLQFNSFYHQLELGTPKILGLTKERILEETRDLSKRRFIIVKKHKQIPNWGGGKSKCV